MTTYTDEFTGIATRTQEATATALRSWAGVATDYAHGFTPENPLPQPAAVHSAVDTWFDLAAALLAEQRKLASGLIDAGTEAAGTATEQVRAAAEQVRSATEQVRTAATSAATTATKAATSAAADAEAATNGEAPKRTRSAR
jgi:hypothetical protein